jgi:hypothetical protein
MSKVFSATTNASSVTMPTKKLILNAEPPFVGKAGQNAIQCGQDQHINDCG